MCAYDLGLSTVENFLILAGRVARRGQPDEEGGRYYPPSDTTFQRVLNRVEVGQLAAIIGAWLAEQQVDALCQLAVDGKVLRGSGRHDGKPCSCFQPPRITCA